ncbi:Protein of unknown function [Micromonospora pallida]|uniref:DUF2637 domain-containing protein n=1 Tax=Micromonospora pallida TaxID=145854 RepID=A0A1C6TKT6_9ACTN|nr:DUF2637 domain-containing protein [Micromonospora pallida]SCL42173.1 Protein of unknown function [Micromonospora pallida]SCL43371.1 Protein of unknown function [Micromonospora pallida]
MSTATDAPTGAATRTTTVGAPTVIALLLIAGVWVCGAVWSYEEQTHLAKSLGFQTPELLPLTLDGMAVAMAAVAFAASLDARPAVYARLITAVAIGASAASNASAAWRRSDGDEQTVILAAGVAVAAMFAFEVLLGEVRRQVLRRRGQPGPVAIVYPRMVRLALAPWPTFAAWRRLVLDATDPQRDFGKRPPIKATVVDESDPGIQLCRQLEQQMATARQALSPGIARVAMADHALTRWPATTARPVPAVVAPERRALSTTAAPVPTTAVASESTTVAATKPATRRRTVVARTDHAPTTKTTRKATTKTVTKSTTAGSEADRTAAAYAAFVADHGHPPSGAELATMAGVSKSYANNWKRDHAPATKEN